MLKKLLNKINSYFVYRELQSHIAKEELAKSFGPLPTAIRESHETYRLGDFTATVVGSKEELEARQMILKAELDRKQARRYQGWDKVIVDKLRD